ncbi:MAG TPA: hypothetical protein DC001_07500, partial [Clostridiales bacterium]|nr:hypothetical protein [Clostridiales bacterium]
MGGHMVTISDAAELKKVTDLADDYGVRLVWIGFYRDQNGNLVWLNDEDISYYDAFCRELLSKTGRSRFPNNHQF